MKNKAFKNNKSIQNNVGKRVPSKEKPKDVKSILLRGKTFFLTYKGFLSKTKKISKHDLKVHLVDNVGNLKKTNNPEKYIISEESYANGESHFHVILSYNQRKTITDPRHFDYETIHPNIQTLRNLKAALEYVQKEDRNPLTNVDLLKQLMVEHTKSTKHVYRFLQQHMLKDPFNFDVDQFLEQHDLYKQIYKTNYTKALNLLKRRQNSTCHRYLTTPTLIKQITRELIEESLSLQELTLFDSWPGYQRIVDHINSVREYKCIRPFKTLQPLIVGEPSIGKTTLINELRKYFVLYPMNVSNWFPKYKDGIYQIFSWNEFRLTGKLPYSDILQLLEGSVMDLQYKGGSAIRRDNQLIIMTSNLTLKQHINRKFVDTQSRKISQQNLGVRIQELIVPKGKTLFLLLKLLKKPFEIGELPYENL